MMPGEGRAAVLEDLAFALTSKAAGLASRAHPIVRASVEDLGRSMNCYYSNLIEGHDTYPLDIERAMDDAFAKEPRRRALQLEARAHIAVQGAIDAGTDPPEPPTSVTYLRWVHRRFTELLPPELRVLDIGDTGRTRAVVPGELRRGAVRVGRHAPPRHSALPAFLARFEEAYAPSKHSKVRQIVSVAAAHHRFLWIHPFDDGNGRVARLASHAALRRLGLGNGLWSVARGLARNVERYKALLQAADEPRRGDLDGRGTLTEGGLVEFCVFFLETAIDQLDFMDGLFAFETLSSRIERYCDEAIARGTLPRGSFLVLREALIAGEVSRGRIEAITGYADRQARTIVAALLAEGLLSAAGPRAPLRLAFPTRAVVPWFPRLYPPLVEARIEAEQT